MVCHVTSEEAEMKLYEIVLRLHLLGGVFALCAFWTNAFLRKGGSAHRRVGRAYLIAMLTVIVTGLPLAADAFLKGQQVRGLFLTYLLSLTASACWTLWRAVRDKKQFARYAGLPFRAFAWSNMTLGTTALIFGALYQQPVLFGFSLVGIVSGAVDLRYAARSPADPKWWLIQHYTSAVGCGIATHIAFILLGLSRLIPGYGHLVTVLGWFGPLVVAPVALIFLKKKYGKVAVTSDRPAPGHGVASGA
jgi:uncharacterized membrane protein